MKKSVLILVILLGLIAGALLAPAGGVWAESSDAEIEALKNMIEDIERKRAAEIDMLKQRIKALEEERAREKANYVAPAPAAEEVEELKSEVATLKSKLDDQEPSFDKITRFMEEHKLKAGLRLQTWYQFVEDGTSGGDKNLNDFMIRRFYITLKGEVLPNLGFFSNIANDRLGQDGLDNSSMGLGSGIAIRDAWIYYNLHPAFQVQMGRMYIPFTRNYGTTSTFFLLPLDLGFTQGGVRGNIFYTSKVGRDDGVVVWGNPFDGKVQYRLGVFEGVEDDFNPANPARAGNPDDNVRFAGRFALNLLDQETKWFNKGSYLGKKKVLALGAGFDYQEDLILNGRDGQNNLGWTVDLFFDHPVGNGAVTFEAAYIKEHNVTQTIPYSWLVSGDDAYIYYAQGGYLLPCELGPGRFQPYVRYERLNVDGKPDTGIPCAGLNYFLKGHDAKLTLDWTLIDQRTDFAPARGNYSGEDQNILTFQASVGF
jgi:hypothetical protein